MTLPLFEFHVTPSLEVTDQEIESLWHRAIAAQKAMDSFLAGELSGHELTDHFDILEIDPRPIEQTLENNIAFLGLD
jgi:hypothetical protein